MKDCSSSHEPHVTGLRVALALSLFAGTVMADPITYTAFTITDGQIGSWSFHNARVYLKFDSDTSTVQFLQLPIDPNNPLYGTVDIYINPTGKASVTVVSGDRVVTAHLDPNQVFVSLDMGDTIDAPHLGGRGIGFGCYLPGGGIAPAYPLGIEDGTVDWGDDSDSASPSLSSLSFDLQHNVGLSGCAWCCSGFDPSIGDNSLCPQPPALKTDQGDFFLYTPYRGMINDPFSPTPEAPLNAGFFIAQLGRTGNGGPWLLPFGGDPTVEPTGPGIRYSGYVISDVTLGKNHFSGAQVYISFDSDTTKVAPLSDGPSQGFINANGKARVTIVSGLQTISAQFDDGEIYVYYDVANANIGFGSQTGGRGYPLSLTPAANNILALDGTTVGAVSDIALTPSDASNYTPETASLATDLRNQTALSGAASSCVVFDPTTCLCSQLTPKALHTNRGDFYLFEPYTAQPWSDTGPTPGAPVASLNWGVFWSELK